MIGKSMEVKEKISKWVSRWLIWGMLLCMVGCQAKESLLYVNGEAVSQEEMELLDQDIDQAIRMKVLQQWAKESGVIETAFSYKEMLQRMEEENRHRVEQKAAGGIVYGVLEYTPLQYYNVEMGKYERLLKDYMIREVSQEELEIWYQGHKENYWQIGEIQAVLTISYDGRVLSEQEISLNSYNYRSLSEQDEELVNHLVNLSEGEDSCWLDEYDREWILQCTSREEGTYQPFEEVMGAVSEQYASERLEKELSEKVAASEVEDLRE